MCSCPYTTSVFRAVAALVAVAMLSTSASAVLQHVHAYADGDHGDHDHDHGLAAHMHAAATHLHHAEPHSAAHTVEIEGCDPGQHAVSVKFVCAAPEPHPTLVAVTVEAVPLSPPPVVWPPATPSDVRAHSPPRLTDAPLRAPPVVHPA